MISFDFHNQQDNPNLNCEVCPLDQTLLLRIIQVSYTVDFKVLFVTVFDVDENACDLCEVTLNGDFEFLLILALVLQILYKLQLEVGCFWV